MHDTLAQLHEDTYNALADEYESRVETYRAVTTKALQPFITALPNNARVLDVGCAVGYVVEILRQYGNNAEGIDISSKMIKYAQKRNPEAHFEVGDFLEVSYKPASFDGAVFYAFIHLFPKDIAHECMKKVTSILKPGALLFIGTTKSAEASEGFEQKSDYGSNDKRYRKRWTQPEIEAFCSDYGLAIIHYEDNIDEFGKVWMDYTLRKS